MAVSTGAAADALPFGNLGDQPGEVITQESPAIGFVALLQKALLFNQVEGKAGSKEIAEWNGFLPG